MQPRPQPAGPPEPFEHALRARTDEELVVTLDDGGILTVEESPMQIFSSGERVRVIRDEQVTAGAGGTRAEALAAWKAQ